MTDRQRGPATAIPAPRASAHGRRLLGLAWLSVGLIPVMFFVGMVVGDGLFALQGVEVEADQFPPIDATLAAGIPAVLIMITPAISAIVLGLRARRGGVGSGIIPAVLGVLYVAYAIIANALPRVLGP